MKQMKILLMSIGILTALLAGSYVSAQENQAPVESAPGLKALRLDYSTYLGGSGDESASGMAVDGQGNIYLTSWTHSTDFPTTPNALNKTPTGIYVAKLSPAGGLLYSTFLGAASGINYAHGVAVDKAGCIYIAGNTTNPKFPVTPGAFQTTFKGPSEDHHGDAFVMKLSPAGDKVIYSTFLGGTGHDICGKIAVDAEGNAYVLGSTSSKDFPVTPGAFQTTFKGGEDNPTGRGDIFVAKLNPDGSKLVYCTYIGGSGSDVYGENLVVDAAGSVCFAGTTTSRNFPTTTNAFSRSYKGGTGARGMGDAFIVKLNPAGSALEYASYIGGRGDERGSSVAVDNDGNIWVAGEMTSADFPTTPDAYCRQLKGGTDGFFAKINPRDGALLYSSLLGGRGSDTLMIAIHRSGLLVLTGRTDSPDFPVTPGAMDTTFNGEMDLFVALFDPVAKSLRYSTYFGGHSNEAVSALICRGDDLYLAGNTTSADFPVTANAWDKTFHGGGGSNPWGGDAFAVKFTLTDKSGALIDPAKKETQNP